MRPDPGYRNSRQEIPQQSERVVTHRKYRQSLDEMLQPQLVAGGFTERAKEFATLNIQPRFYPRSQQAGGLFDPQREIAYPSGKVLACPQGRQQASIGKLGQGLEIVERARAETLEAVAGYLAIGPRGA